jgi:vacuolar-type H+-ATPase subunit H
MSSLLERLRRMRPPPGPAAGVVAVPTAGDRLVGEVAFLFAPLEEIEDRSDHILSGARLKADALLAGATAQCQRVLDDAAAEAERVAAGVLADHRSRCEERARMILANAEQEAERVRTRARERMPALLTRVAARMLEGK